MLAFNALKAVGGVALTSARMPVKVKKFPSTEVRLAGTMKSVRMFGSPAITVRATEMEKMATRKALSMAMLLRGVSLWFALHVVMRKAQLLG